MVDEKNSSLKNLAGLFRNARTRTIIILTGIVLVLAVIIGVVRLNSQPSGPAAAAQVGAGGPGNIQSVPGGFVRPETQVYAQLQEQQNAQQANIAAQTGSSAVPTIISSNSFPTPTATNSQCCSPCGCPNGNKAQSLLTGQASNLVPGTLVYDSQGRVIGTVGPDGKVRDANGNVIGTVGPDGLVRDANGNVIGTASNVAAGTPVYDAQGRLLGTVGADGKVRDAQGNIIGTVGPDGVVKDLNGNIIGKAGTSFAGKPVYDAQGNLLGTVGADGKVRDAKGNVIGTVDQDGNVRDAAGDVIGKVANASGLSGTPVYDSQGHLIGTVGPDGKVRDASGRVIGTLGADGLARDLNGNVIGKAATNAGGTPVFGPKGQMIGTLGADGKVRDASGNVIGTAGPDGTVKDLNGNTIGTASSAVPGTPAYDPAGNLIGTVGPDGQIRDASGKIVGKLGPAGNARDAAGNIIGRVGNSVPGMAAYDNQGKPLGIVGADGKVRDANGNVVGTVMPNGDVKDASGNIVGKVGAAIPGTPVYDKLGHLIGTVGTDGLVRDDNGNVIGKVGPDGLVRDATGNIVGKTGATLTGTPVYDAQGRLIGLVGPDGKVRDANGKILGTVGVDGNVRDANGNVIGSTTPPSATPATTAAGAGIPEGLAAGTTLPPAPGNENTQLQQIVQRQQEMVSKQQADQNKQQIQGLMAGQASQLIAAWASPVQTYVAGSQGAKGVAGGEEGYGEGGAIGNAATQAGGGAPAAVKAGTVMFGVLITSVNSDQPGPVLATIVEGKFKGARLLGSLTNQGQTVLLTFNTMNLPGDPSSVSVNIVAIDQNTARTSFSTYTDNHYLLRYGSLFASSFLQGYGQAFLTSGQTITTNGLVTQTNNPNLAPSGKFMVALGNVGTRYSSVLGNIFNTPPTVHVKSGTAMGLLFISDVPSIPGYGDNSNYSVDESTGAVVPAGVTVTGPVATEGTQSKCCSINN